MVSRFFHTDLKTCMLMPLDQLQVFLSRIEPIQAHESLVDIRNNQLGGFVEKKDFRRATRELEKRQRSLFESQQTSPSEIKRTQFNQIIQGFQSGAPIGHLVDAMTNKKH